MNTPKNYAESVRAMINSNYSERSVNAMFEAETMLDNEMYEKQKYQGLDSDTKQAFMIDDCNEASACNDVFDYYED
jgi:hypothetical protein